MYKPVRGIKKEFARERGLFVIILPVLLFYLLFKYIPLVYNIGAFKAFVPSLGLLRSPLAGRLGFGNFFDLFESGLGARLLINQLRIGAVYLLIGFPAPIILAALTHEMRHRRLAHAVQTITIAPMFVSPVVLCGLISSAANFVGIGDNPSFFPIIYAASMALQETGWWALVYAVSLGAINRELSDAAKLCGAGRLGVFYHVTLPGIFHSVCALFLVRVSLLFTVDYERVILLYNNATVSASDVLPAYAYRAGIILPEYSAALAAGVINGMLNLTVAVIGYLVYRNVVRPWFDEDFKEGYA